MTSDNFLSGEAERKSAQVAFLSSKIEPEAIHLAAKGFPELEEVTIHPGPYEITCSLRWNKAMTTSKETRFLSEFRYQVLDQQWRLRIRREKRPLNMVVLAITYAKLWMGR